MLVPTLPLLAALLPSPLPLPSSSKYGVSPSSVATGRRSVLLGAGAAASLSLLPPAPAIAADAGLFAPPAGSLSGTTIFITGANTGLGLESAKRLATAGANIIVAARSKAKADAAVAEVALASGGAGKVVGIELDLADLSSVKTLPKRLEATVGSAPVIDVLMNNAGVMAVPERASTRDGFEKTVGINHLGHFALVAGLLPSLERASNGFRVITVSSDAHRFVDKKAMAEAIDAKLDLPTYAAGGWGAYGVSKAANVLFTVELERRLEMAGLKGTAVTLHPGVVQTDLARYIVGGMGAEDAHPTQEAAAPTGVGKFFKANLLDKVVLPVERGANTQVYLASATDTGGDRTRRGGLYFDAMKAVAPTDAASDGELARRLWDLSEALTGTKFSI